jgi:hypothetical protein
MAQKTSDKKRVRKPGKTAILRRTKRIKPTNLKPLPGVFSLVRDTFRHIWRHKKTFGGILLVYVLFSLVFVKTLSSNVNITSLRDQYGDVLGLSGLVLNSALVADVAGSGAGTEIGSLYQTIILLITALASIWLFRQTTASKQTVQVRDPFYRGMTPLIPFLLIAFVIGLELLPMLGGISLFSMVQNNGLAATTAETLVWALLGFSLAMVTFYLLSSTIFALIIVTLPNMRPVAALRGARKLTAFRRWLIMRKLFWVVLLTVVSFFSLLLVTVWLAPILAEWVALAMGGCVVIFMSGFGYKLYRALL